ncbi:MAG: polysaccharide deacetylase family protein [Clostridia bacterium]|nr:polysaccharide deacetylase family protein [Clostridia bacterium]
MKKIHGLLSILLFFVLLVNISSATSVSWYCSRMKNHIQPTLGSDLLFSSKYNVFWCDERYPSIEDEEKVIYLTFDAGYENGNVEKIIDILNEENVKGAFFILDNLILKNQDLVKKMIESGHTVANHTLKHKDMTKIKSKEEFAKELSSLEELYYNTFGENMPRYYRPPEGKLNEENLSWADELGYKTIMWSFAYADWDNGKQPSKEYALNKIMENIHNGEVMLLHPTSKTNAEILKEVIVKLKDQGFRFGTLDELCENRM